MIKSAYKPGTRDAADVVNELINKAKSHITDEGEKLICERLPKLLPTMEGARTFIFPFQKSLIYLASGVRTALLEE